MLLKTRMCLGKNYFEPELSSFELYVLCGENLPINPRFKIAFYISELENRSLKIVEKMKRLKDDLWHLKIIECLKKNWD